MKKKKDEFYYKNLNQCAGYACRAAEILQETLKEFDQTALQEKMEQVHELEQQGDTKRHKMMAVLNQAFITPIEREDLIALSNALDDTTDSIEEILLQIYMCRVEAVRKDLFPVLEILLESVRTLENLIGELENFKHSQKLENYIIRVNDLEEQGDRLYMENMYRLHGEADGKMILTWRTIYECVETCLDTCEHAADIVETVRMKNL